ncbi:MAG: DUF302 domain-containing protein [Dehalococcoidia bacterium]|nr:DUF302 domain-containing protein [Dehalococcoidia bacterium]
MISYLDDYTVTTAEAPEAAVSALRSHARGKGFQVLDVHDLSEAFDEDGRSGEPAYVVELCNVELATGTLHWNPVASLMMPCKIAVYRKDGETRISALRPNPMAKLFPHFAAHMEVAYRVMVSIVEEFRSG